MGCVTLCRRRHVGLTANRTPLMTSESAANHGASLYGYHDNRSTPAAAAAAAAAAGSENKRPMLRGGGGVVYDER